MKITRRTILQAAGAFGLLGTRSWAATEASFGETTFQTLSDGHMQLPLDFLLTDPAELAKWTDALAQAGVSGPQYRAPLNVTLMRRGQEIVLFDAGSGPDFLPTAGQLPDGLAALDIAPEDITHIVFTHAHPDHMWGVLDDFDEPLFPQARYFLGQLERDYWISPDIFDTLPTERQPFATGAQRRIEALGDKLELFSDGDELMPGLRAQMTPGHTPGHMSFVIDEKLMVVGDAIGNGHLAFMAPSVHAGPDHDPALGAQTRVALLEQLAGSDMTMIGYHLPDGGIGRVKKTAQAFEFNIE